MGGNGDEADFVVKLLWLRIIGASVIYREFGKGYNIGTLQGAFECSYSNPFSLVS